MHFSVLYLSILLFPMSFTICSLLKAAYPHVPRNHLVCLRKVRRLMSRTYIGSYSTGTGSNHILRSHVLLVGKNCHGSRETRTAKQYGMPAAWPFNFPIHMETNFLF